MAVDPSRARIAILGCGAVGQAFAADLLQPGRGGFRGSLALWSRGPSSARRLAARLQRSGVAARRVQSGSLCEVLAGARVVLSCVADGAHGTLARALAQALPAQDAGGLVLLVSSGFVPLARLASLERRGLALGRLHPLTPVLRAPRGHVRGVPFGIEGDARALRSARRLVGWLEGTPLRLGQEPGSARAYHAGAALLGGGLVALFHLAEQMLGRGLQARPREVRAALAHFARAVTDGCERSGPAEALTGPLARGSEETVRGHVAALGRVPNGREAYRVLGRTMLELARTQGSLDAATERRLRAFLRAAGRGR